jgi:hypothetical protein
MRLLELNFLGLFDSQAALPPPIRARLYLHKPRMPSTLRYAQSQNRAKMVSGKEKNDVT